MNRRWLLLPLFLVLLLAALRWSQARSGPFRVSGFLESDEIRVGSRVGGRVAAVRVEEGARVAAGDVLVELEPFDLLERRAERQAHLERARAEHARRRAGFRPEEIAGARARTEALSAQLARLVAGPRAQEVEAARARRDAARAALHLAELEEARTRSLVAEAIRSVEALDRSQALLEAARAQLRAGEEELALLEEGSRPEDVTAAEAELRGARAALALLERGEREEDVAAAQAQVHAAEAALRAAELALGELAIRAPLSAVVEACDLEPGDLVAAGAPVALLRDDARVFVRAYVPVDRLTFGLGARAWVSVDARPEQRFAARVTFIAGQAEFTPSNQQTPEERSHQVLRVRVLLEEGAELLRPGVPVDVGFEE